MRDELRQLEGDRVIVTGTVSYIQQRPEGHYDVRIQRINTSTPQPCIPFLS